MGQNLELKLKGLYLNPNDLSEVPQGAMHIADNVVLDKESIIESRRGQNFYGNQLADVPKKLFNYKSKLLVNFGNKLAYDSNGSGSWINYSGDYIQPDLDYKIRSLEANRNFYFTTTKGIYKLDALTSNPVPAGAVAGLDGQASLINASGFMNDDRQVAYRIVWGYKDLNGNLILGSPSQRIIVINSSGHTSDVEISFTIPAGITSNYFYQIYRSGESANATSVPNDEMYLVYEDSPTPAEILALEVTVVDQTPYTLVGATLYTSPSQEGIAASNEQPPFAKDIDVYKNYTLYANTKNKQRLTITLISVGSNNAGFGYKETTATFTNTSNVLTAVDTANIRVGMHIEGPFLPANTKVIEIIDANSLRMSASATVDVTYPQTEFKDVLTINGVDYYGGQVMDIPNNVFKVETGFTPAENIALTAQNFIEVFNKSDDNEEIYAYYTSGYSDLPGRILLSERQVGGPAYSLTSSNGSAFNPVLPIVGSSVSSDNEEKMNRIYYSKNLEPEAVPIANFFDIGSADSPIQRVVSLRDSVFIFKTDGIFRLTGENPTNFTISLFDSTAILKARESAVAFNNQVYTFSSQGIVSVSDNGVSVVSRPIENTLLKLSSDQYINFDYETFAVAYESERKYMFFTISQQPDLYPSQAFIYNSFTNSWTRWIMNRTCGIVNTADNKLYMGNPDTDYVYKERKEYTLNDYADESYPVNITSVSDKIVTVTSSSMVKVGMSLGQGNRKSLILEKNGNDLTLENTLSWTLGSAEVFTPIKSKVQWVPEAVGNPGILKHFREITLMFREAQFYSVKVGFATNFSRNFEYVNVRPKSSGTWGSFSWGDSPWGGELGKAQPIRTFVLKEKQRASWLDISLEHNQAFSSFSLAGISVIYNPMTERFR